MAIEGSGNILVIDRDADINNRGEFRGALFRVNPRTGERTLLSDFGNPDHGPKGENPVGLAIEDEVFIKGGGVFSGSLLVIDEDAGTDGRGALFRVNARNGERKILSDFGDGEPLGGDPIDLAIDGFGNIQVIDNAVRPPSGEIGRGALFEVNISTCNPPSIPCKRTVLSDFNDSMKGDLGQFAQGIAIVPVPLVVDIDAQPNPNLPSNFTSGALFRVDPFTGERTVLNDFNVSTQDGIFGNNPFDVAIEGPDSILVIDPIAHNRPMSVLFRINPSTCKQPPCTRTALCELGTNEFGLAIEGEGKVLVTDADAGMGRDPTAPNTGLGALFRVDTSTCNATVVTDFGNPGLGLQLGEDPFDVAVGAFGSIRVIDPDAGSRRGILFGVSPNTGRRTVISDFGKRSFKDEPLGFNPRSLAIEASDDILAVDSNAGTDKRGALFRVKLSTGARTMLSDFGNDAQGPLGANPTGVAVEASGNILVIDEDADINDRRKFSGALFRVNPHTGRRRVLSDFGNPDQGPLGITPLGVAVALTPNFFVQLIP